MKMLVIAAITLLAGAVFGQDPPEPKLLGSLVTRDGKTYTNIREVIEEDDGKVKIVHEGGIARVHTDALMPSSQLALGLPPTETETAEVLKIKSLQTLDGKEYKGIRSVRVKPSFISFVHSDGAASVRFTDLSADIRDKCGYDEELAVAFDRERAIFEKDQARREMAIELARKEALANAEFQKARQRALGFLRYSNFGSNNYWMGSARERQLQDAMAAAVLRDGGFSEEEGAYYLDQQRFR